MSTKYIRPRNIRIYLLIIAVYYLFTLSTSCVSRIDGPIMIDSSIYPKIEIDLGYNSASYTQKVYYNFEEQKVIKSSNSLDWDIAFSSPVGTLRPTIMNYALGASCNGFTKRDTNFATIITDREFQSNQLFYSNYYDSTAILFESGFSSGQLLKYVYYMNLESHGFFKIQILDYNANNVTIRYARLDQVNGTTVTIPISNTQNYTYFSFITNQVQDIEPADKSSWDIEFTKYTTYITDFGFSQVYGVTGAILNPSKNIRVAEWENYSMDGISNSVLNAGNYQTNLTAIGYDWKKWSSPGVDGFYTIPKRTYAIKSNNDTYLIQFIEFSKLIGSDLKRGFPTFLQKKL